MAKNMQPILKRCKALGISPSVLGINKETRRNPKQGRRKQSEYAIQLNEKQKAKFIYCFTPYTTLPYQPLRVPKLRCHV